MKILVISQYFYPEDFRINDICKGLKEKGHEVEILTGLPNYPEGKLYKGYSIFNKGPKKYENMKIYRTLMVTRGKDSSIRLGLNYLSFMILGSFKALTLLNKKYDRVFVFQVSPITSAIPALIIKKFKKVKSYIYIQDLWPETFYSIINVKNKHIRRFLKKICIKIYNGFDYLLLASKGYEDILVKNIDRKKFIYFPQWAEDFYGQDLKEHKKEKNKKFNVTFAGNIGKAQSVETIIKAASICENEDIIWNIIGDGSEFEKIKAMVKEKSLENKVILHGRRPSSDMPKYFSMSDGLIVTLKNEEILKVTLPAKVQSYMAAGKPIIGALSGEGNRIIKESKCGFSCEAEDYKGLCENVVKLYNMSDNERENIGKRGKSFFENNFSRKKLLNELDKFLKT